MPNHSLHVPKFNFLPAEKGKYKKKKKKLELEWITWLLISTPPNRIRIIRSLVSLITSSYSSAAPTP